ERECKLYDAFDKFTHINEESLHTYYLRFTQLINDMNIYKMNVEQFQVNTKFLNSLPPEWSKFVTDVKLVKYFHTSYYDQLHVYLKQHELHANENEDLDTYDSDYDDLSNAQAVLMANISNYDSNVISEVPNSNNYLNDIDNQKNECLLETFNAFKNKSKEKENESMETEIDLEEKIKELNNIVFKVGQSAQTVHMLTKPQAFFDNVHKQALGYQNSFYLKKAQRMKPTLYDGSVISEKHVAMPVIDNEETLILEEESRSKMSEKAKDLETIKQNISHKPIDYEKLNRLTEDFEKRFTPQQELSAEQAFWLHISTPTIEYS
nr:integrase, catalytic region, zinc finger, CCHC-type, peptidase aspartic, catalytic [Tanacetum cinerariifolium]